MLIVLLHVYVVAYKSAYVWLFMGVINDKMRSSKCRRWCEG